eukprot:246745-Amphidinium_carterae.1
MEVIHSPPYWPSSKLSTRKLYSRGAFRSGACCLKRLGCLIRMSTLGPWPDQEHDLATSTNRIDAGPDGRNVLRPLVIALQRSHRARSIAAWLAYTHSRAELVRGVGVDPPGGQEDTWGGVEHPAHHSAAGELLDAPQPDFGQRSYPLAEVVEAVNTVLTQEAEPIETWTSANLLRQAIQMACVQKEWRDRSESWTPSEDWVAEEPPSKLHKWVCGSTKVWELAVQTEHGYAASPGAVDASELHAWSRLSSHLCETCGGQTLGGTQWLGSREVKLSELTSGLSVNSASWVRKATEAIQALQKFSSIFGSIPSSVFKRGSYASWATETDCPATYDLCSQI